MGCICSKGASISKNRGKDKESKKASSKRFIAASKKEEVVVEVDNGANDATARLISTENAEKSAGSTPPSRDEGEKPSGVVEKSVVLQMPGTGATGGRMSGEQPQMSRIFSVRDGVDGAQAVAGWPSWLTAAAGEAIKGWIPRKADSFEKLDKVCQQFFSSLFSFVDVPVFLLIFEFPVIGSCFFFC